MGLPFFYIHQADSGTDSLVLDESNSRHAISVLRMELNEALHLTDGKGQLLTGVITDPHKKKCRVRITAREWMPPAAPETAIGISLVKNPVRFEWFLEKATEIGISAVLPLICERTEKQHFRQERMQHVLVSAMLQSRQCWLPRLDPPTPFEKLVTGQSYQQKFIAHCVPQEKKTLGRDVLDPQYGQLVLIGPEGDFSEAEIRLAGENGFVPVALGATRLRTETAGIAAAVLLKNRS